MPLTYTEKVNYAAPVYSPSYQPVSGINFTIEKPSWTLPSAPNDDFSKRYDEWNPDKTVTNSNFNTLASYTHFESKAPVLPNYNSFGSKHIGEGPLQPLKFSDFINPTNSLHIDSFKPNIANNHDNIGVGFSSKHTKTQ